MCVLEEYQTRRLKEELKVILVYLSHRCLALDQDKEHKEECHILSGG